MKTTASLLIIAMGGILAFAVNANTLAFNWNTAGVVLILVGLAGLFLPRRSYGWLGRRVVSRVRRRHGGRRSVDQTTYVVRAPGYEGVTVLPAVPEAAEGGDRPPVAGGSDVTEDVYEEEE
jgi:hypothetical protein